MPTVFRFRPRQTIGFHIPKSTQNRPWFVSFLAKFPSGCEMIRLLPTVFRRCLLQVFGRKYRGLRYTLLAQSVFRL